METSWKISLIANSTAIAVSGLLGIWYSHHQKKNIKDDDKLSVWTYVVAFILVALGAFLSYLVAYLVFGYVPMSKISKGII